MTMPPVKTLLALAGIGFLWAGMGLAQTCAVSLADHDALTPGMTLSEAVGVIGCEGIAMGGREVDGVTLASFIWDGNGASGSNMILLFADDTLLNRQQIGLQ